VKVRIQITEEIHPVLGKVFSVAGNGVKVREPWAPLQRSFKNKKAYRRNNRVSRDEN